MIANMFRVTVINNSKIKTDFSGLIVKLSVKTFTEINDLDSGIFGIQFWTDGDDFDVKELEKEFNCSIFIISRDNLNKFSDSSVQKVAVFDLDSTLIQMEVIDTLAESKPEIAAQVSKITEESMAGRLDFRESLKRRANLLQGIFIDDQWDFIKQTVKFTPGVERLFKTVLTAEHGWETAVISGGFVPIAEWVKDRLGLTWSYANALETDSQGILTGNLVSEHPIVDSSAKRAQLLQLSQDGNIISVAVGDGANDLPMLSEATVGIAFNAKPIVQEQANFRLNHENLFCLSYILN